MDNGGEQMCEHRDAGRSAHCKQQRHRRYLRRERHVLVLYPERGLEKRYQNAHRGNGDDHGERQGKRRPHRKAVKLHGGVEHGSVERRRERACDERPTIGGDEEQQFDRQRDGVG